ncbi:aldo/keto reductase [Pelomonas sp. KK5]|uniref:aldo/keto reductase n=1 Tax=Pelomonas sp. KK5 TaxID=1855730 RepID=UPI00097C6F66|nr:aldo/keto reductase [Pelomonas sp. KK5]
MNILFQKTHQRGFGTWPLSGEVLTKAIADALAAGYRAFDTAQMYGNEAEVGAALAGAGVPRGELCITTKIHPDNFAEERFLPSLRESLDKLQIAQVDVLLLHWPPVGGDVAPPLKLLEEAHRLGLAANIGVSNFNAAMMRTAHAAVAVPLVTNQVEFHPLLDQRKLLAAAEETGIPLSSYCSVARGEIFKYPRFDEIGQGYGKSAAQVALRWILQTGVTINTMSTKPDNIRANFELMDFTLSSVDMARIDALRSVGYRLTDTWNSPWAPSFD